METIKRDEILTVPEMADYLKMSQSNIYYLIARNELPHIKIGRNVRVRLSDLLRWLEDNFVQQHVF